MVAIAPGIALAHSVVPSSGSTAISTLGPVLRPTSSPMNSIGASSRSPSPITTVPWIGSLLSSRRIASTAAWSAAFSLPRPRRRARRLLAPPAGGGARRYGGALGHPHDLERENPLEHLVSLDGNRGHLLSPSDSQVSRPSILLDTNDLRRARYHPIALHRRKGAPHRILGRRIGNQDDRNRASRLVR